uniref:Uncharacterized protein n=1 Tax=Anopheles farauti TaxID=69004 RepID=A0A182QL86_9DIPT
MLSGSHPPTGPTTLASLLTNQRDAVKALYVVRLGVSVVLVVGYSLMQLLLPARVPLDLTEEGLAVGGVTVRGSDLSDGGVSQRGGELGNRGNSLDGQRLTVDDGVESVDGIGGVLDDATSAIGLNQRRSVVSSQRGGVDTDGTGDGHNGGEEGEL